MKTTQASRVLDYIRKNGSITGLEALRDLGVMSLSRRITDLKRRGEHVGKETITVQNRYGEKCRIAKYFLEDK